MLLGSSVLAVALAAGFAVFVLTRSGGVIIGGPVGPPTNSTGECVPGPPGALQTDGFDILKNQGSQVAVIERLSLRSPHGLRLAGAFLVPLSGGDAVGVWHGFPPPARQVVRDLSGIEWARRESPRDARLLPGHRVNAVLGVQATSRKPGSAAGLAVHYRVGSQQYLFLTQSQIVIRTAPEHC
jgi:hypothetical protein